VNVCVCVCTGAHSLYVDDKQEAKGCSTERTQEVQTVTPLLQLVVVATSSSTSRSLSRSLSCSHSLSFSRSLSLLSLSLFLAPSLSLALSLARALSLSLSLSLPPSLPPPIPLPHGRGGHACTTLADSHAYNLPANHMSTTNLPVRPLARAGRLRYRN
jgi:hypothetical protein